MFKNRKIILKYKKLNYNTKFFTIKFQQDNLKLVLEEKEFLNKKNLSIHNDDEKINTIKFLIEECKNLEKENSKLKYRKEHLLNTINIFEVKQ